MNDGTYRRLAAAVLVAHQQIESSHCLCGRLRLGDSWAEHVAEVLEAAGALRQGPPPDGCTDPDCRITAAHT